MRLLKSLLLSIIIIFSAIGSNNFEHSAQKKSSIKSNGKQPIDFLISLKRKSKENQEHNPEHINNDLNSIEYTKKTLFPYLEKKLGNDFLEIFSENFSIKHQNLSIKSTNYLISLLKNEHILSLDIESINSIINILKNPIDIGEKITWFSIKKEKKLTIEQTLYFLLNSKVFFKKDIDNNYSNLDLYHFSKTN